MSPRNAIVVSNKFETEECEHLAHYVKNTLGTFCLISIWINYKLNCNGYGWLGVGDGDGWLGDGDGWVWLFWLLLLLDGLKGFQIWLIFSWNVLSVTFISAQIL